MSSNDKGKKEDARKNKDAPGKQPFPTNQGTAHLGSSNAFEETEDPRSADPDGITDEKLDEWMDENPS